MRILQVEDDSIVASGNALLLKSIGAAADTAETGAEALEILRSYEYDIIIVDLHLPDMSGDVLVQKIRARNIDTPVLMLTGFPALDSKIKAFGVGVDDFLAKPVANAELIARVRAIVRRTHGFSHRLLTAGKLVLDLDSGRTTVAGTEVRLTQKERSVLELLLLRRGRAVSKAVIMDHLYGSLDAPVSRTIDVFVCYLRKKLAQVGAADLIRTVAGTGYIIEAPAAVAVMPDVDARPGRDEGRDGWSMPTPLSALARPDSGAFARMAAAG